MGSLALDTSAAPVSLTAVATNLLLCAAFAFLLAWHFRKFGSTFSNRAKFSQVLAPIAMTTMLVIMVVKSNLILSLGLVGALSIVRFRTPVKEPEELAYLFLAIALGLGLGADPKGLAIDPPGAREVTCISVAVILAILSLRAAFRRDERYPNLYLDVGIPRGDGEPPPDLAGLADEVARHATRVDLRRLDTRADGIQATFYLDCRGVAELSALDGAIRARHPEAVVTFVEQSGLPGA